MSTEDDLPPDDEGAPSEETPPESDPGTAEAPASDPPDAAQPDDPPPDADVPPDPSPPADDAVAIALAAAADRPSAILDFTRPERAVPAIDLIALALSRLPHQYRGGDAGETNTEKALRALLDPAIDLATAMLAVLNGFDVNTAVGAQLDVLGNRVGRPRNGVADNEIYRRYVRAQIVANRSDGVIDDILAVAVLVIGDVRATPVFINVGDAAFILRIEGLTVPDEVAAVLIALVRKATSAGRRALVGYTPGAPETQGRWSQSLWGTGRWSSIRDKEF